MTFGEKLKEVRRQAGMSQEKLAEKLGVSRQAITKWETNAGIPDIENIMAVSTLFHVSIDELLSNEKNITQSKDYLFESVTEYDIDFSKRFDMKLGGANALIMSGYEGEKVRQWQEMFYDRHYSSTCMCRRRSCGTGCNTPNPCCPEYTPDFIALAESYGAKGVRLLSIC